MYLYSSAAALLFLNTVAAAPNAFAQPAPTLAARLALPQESPSPTSAAEPSLITSETIIDSSPGTDSPTLTGRFTAGANGVYSITSISDYVLIAGRTLSPGGGDALIGGVRVTVGGDGVVADGRNVALAEVTATDSNTLILTTVESSAARSVSGQGNTAATNTETAVGRSQGGGGAMATARVGAAVVGGLIGVLAM